MKKIILTIAIFCSMAGFSQEKNFIDKPYIEVSGTADTLVVPNRIYINILISEKDTKGKKSVEELEKDMLAKLKGIGINTDKNVFMQDMISNYQKYFLKSTDILKSKSYSVLVFDAKTTTQVFSSLEQIGISNVKIEKTEYAEEKKVQLLMNSKAIINAKQNALSLTQPINQKIGNALFIGYNINYRNNNDDLVKIGVAFKSEEPNIEFEKIKIESTVTAKFALE